MNDYNIEERLKIKAAAFERLFKVLLDEMLVSAHQIYKISNDITEFDARLNRYIDYYIYEIKHRWDVGCVVNEVSKDE